MSNDGGWCAYGLVSIVAGGGFTRTPSLRVTTPPANGQLNIVRGLDYSRVAYRPNSGFAGDDHFAVWDIEANFGQEFQVTVIKH